MTGSMTSTSLKTVPLLDTTWENWKGKHPDTLVLSADTGYDRAYSRHPYRVRAERVLGVQTGGEGLVKAYPFEELKKVNRFPLKDHLGDQELLIFFDEDSQTAWATTPTGRPVDGFVSYRAAWLSFFPQSAVYTAKKGEKVLE